MSGRKDYAYQMENNEQRMTRNDPSGWKQKSVLNEAKRAGFIVAAVLLIVLLVFGWKELVMPQLSDTFTGTPYINEVNSLLMILGSLAITCLVLVSFIVLILAKIRSITQKLDSWQVSVTPVERVADEDEDKDASPEDAPSAS